MDHAKGTPLDDMWQGTKTEKKTDIVDSLVVIEREFSSVSFSR